MNLFNLVASLKLDNSDYKKKLNESESQAKDFSKTAQTTGMKSSKSFASLTSAVAVATAAIAAAAATMAKLALQTIDYGGDIDDNSQKLNMSAEMYQKWSYLLKLAGTDITTMTTGMRTFTGILESASNGQADALLTLQKLGLGYEDFANLSVEDAFKLVVEQLQKMEEGTAKTQLAQELFGRSGQELLPLLNMEAGSIDELFKKFENLGLIMSDDAVAASASLGDAIDLLKFQFEALGRDVGTALYPLIETIIEFINKLKENPIFTSIAESVSKLIEELSFLEPVFEVLGVLIELIFVNLGNKVNSAISTTTAFVQLLKGDFTGAWDTIRTVAEDSLNSILSVFGLTFDDLKNGIKSFVNFFIDKMNWLIGGLNKLSFTLPDWMGGWHFGIDIPLIPRLQRGMNFIPSDMYPAFLDYGERVLTKTENQQYTSLGGTEGISAIVNGISRVQTNVGQQTSYKQPVVQVFIGDKQIKDFIYKTVDDKMKAQGLKSLQKVGGYK